MHVGNETTVFAKTVYLYDLNFVLKYVGVSVSDTLLIANPPINFLADMTDGLLNTDDSTMGPVTPGNYYIRIIGGDTIDIPAYIYRLSILATMQIFLFLLSVIPVILHV